ncbi:NAD(P)-dependent alcohol dehydrogenase [Gimesia sp.]|uniref:NAD(P)-dependent alcohol dehydrogenase n=1 Tax=Gimesia sp. TaxID=2024833 RepID=UPI000C4CB9CF|nr:NAD(P)-dependent alcohol dehydrogenase [Gimesia sp.]MAX38242.1 quinone oxidoreductase [Gimesia sp.]HAH43725.1 NAD(P)-dependent alcohol dehydrogenase [Planctomycetaceae bacterium]HBL43686.1 NAD(P)-dependent alcohol dehydrogenase [Planctomycetaceae bacterium]|tara:strand:- start:2726 stop:3667 length:942 start_codon:yes stop_codon:yes gene_type:complete
MKAVTYDEYGSPQVLKLSEIDRPDPEDYEVLIQVAAAGINPIDARLRQGEMKWLLPGRFPRVPGYDVAGIVQEADRESDLEPGDRVLAFLDHIYGGASAEYAGCSSRCVVRIPESLSFEQAAGLPLAGSTALQSLRNYGHIKPRDRVLINGASGGVGAFAVQIAVAYGAEVTAVASARHEEFVRSLGASHFFDYQREDFTGSSRKWEIIFDVAGKRSYSQVKHSLARTGQYVTTEPSFRGLAISVLTWPQSEQSHVMLAHPNKEDLTELVRLWSEKQLIVTIADMIPFSDAVKAHQLIEEGGFCGKLVLKPDP